MTELISPMTEIEILVIDDTPANVRLLMQLLEEQGYYVRPVTDGALALGAARLAPPDIILLDIKMPGMDGYDLCRRLKRDPATAHIPIIFLTVLDDITDVVKGFAFGAVDYITKPVKSEELIARIENQIKLRSLEKQLASQNQQLQSLLSQYQLTEAALRESEDKFSKAFHRSPISLSITSLEESQYLDVNEEFVHETGYRRDELIGRTVLDMDFWVESGDRDRLYDILHTQGFVRDFETRFRSKYYDIRDVIVSVDVIYLQEVPYLLAAAKDVTELKTVQANLAARSQELSDALVTLNETQSQLVQSAKMAALGNLVAGIAHEVNTPVGTAILMASTLENATHSIATSLRESTLTQPKFESYLDVAADASHLILDNLNRAGELIQSFKQIAVDQTSLKLRKFRVKAYLGEIITSLSSQLKQTSHTVCILGNDEVEVYSEPGALSQIVTNLVMNALMHAFPENQPGNITLTVSCDDQKWFIAYQDNGIGIGFEQLDKIFEPFYTTARHKGGSGLGLHLVYNLVTQRLNGKISVQSEKNVGTQFVMNFPFHPQPVE